MKLSSLNDPRQSSALNCIHWLLAARYDVYISDTHNLKLSRSSP